MKLFSIKKYCCSLVVIFLAHGTDKYLALKDDDFINYHTGLFKPFSKISWLKDRPTLFFIQACADDSTDDTGKIIAFFSRNKYLQYRS